MIAVKVGKTFALFEKNAIKDIGLEKSGARVHHKNQDYDIYQGKTASDKLKITRLLDREQTIYTDRTIDPDRNSDTFIRSNKIQNIRITGVAENVDLDRKVKLTNGDLVIQKEEGQVIGIYLVSSFWDHKNKYDMKNRASYCSFINLDTGQLAFEERCSRVTSERRVLRHLTRAGYTYPYDPDSKDQDDKFSNMRIQIYSNGQYTMNIALGKEYVVGGSMMTISNLNTNIEDAQIAITAADNAKEVLSFVMKVVQEAKVDLEYVTKVRDKLATASIDINRCKGELQEYKSLLESIARETEITWPPSCNIVDK